MGAPGYYILCPHGHEIGVIEDDLYWDDETFKKLEKLENRKCPVCGQKARYNFAHYGNINDCTDVNLVWSSEDKRWVIPKKLTKEQKKDLKGHVIRKDVVIKTEKVTKKMTKKMTKKVTKKVTKNVTKVMTRCENCKNEKKVTDIEGHLLCKDCEEDIVRCDFCGKFLAISYDSLMVGNFGKLSVPTLSLPDVMTDTVFCNIEHLEGYLKKYKDEENK